MVCTRQSAKPAPLHALEAQARQDRRGLWADEKAEPPWEWRRREPSP
jgi:endonuclease YncB( thermonuclease family)